MSHKKEENKENKSPSLKGTLIAVILLGIFIIISWFGVYALFLSR